MLVRGVEKGSEKVSVSDVCAQLRTMSRTHLDKKEEEVNTMVFTTVASTVSLPLS